MNIEMTEAMQKEIVKQVADRLFSQMQKQINVQSVVDKARQEVVAIVASKAAGEFHKKVNVEGIVGTAVADIEGRINARIAKLMTKGITISLAE